MAITYNWTIQTTEYDKSTGGIFCLHWRVTAEDGGYTASSYGTVGLTFDPTDPDFTPYDEVTEAQAQAWGWGSVDQAKTEAALAAKIDAMKNPTEATGTPW